MYHIRVSSFYPLDSFDTININEHDLNCTVKARGTGMFGRKKSDKMNTYKKNTLIGGVGATALIFTLGANSLIADVLAEYSLSLKATTWLGMLS